MHRIGLLALAALVGACTSLTPLRTPAPEELYAMVEPVGLSDVRYWGDDLTAGQAIAVRRILSESLTRRWEAAGRPAEGLSETVLALSGGGPDGAFAAGMLNGWSESGDRPEFHIVTGVSVGALIAPFAFAGPEFDDELRVIFTETETSDVAQLALFSALRGALAVADTAPLRTRIRTLVDDRLIERIAEGHREGRILLVGTTNLDAGRPVIWNMGKIAAAGRRDLFQDVLLASASIPGVFPPVLIDVEAAGRVFQELHVDGGVTRSVFVGPTGSEMAAPQDLPFPVRRDFYVIQNNALAPPFEPAPTRLTAILGRSVSTLIRAQTEGDLRRIYDQAYEVGGSFNLAFVPAGFGTASAAAFDRQYMTALFERARELGRGEKRWLRAPPGVIGRSELAREIAERAAVMQITP
mgnify:CR=1 FL=1